MNETEEDMKAGYEEQANWFTLGFHNALVPTLMYMYQISSLPHIYVLKPDCTVISGHGVLDLIKYGKNAVLTWLSTSATSKIQRKMSRDANVYGDTWRFLNADAKSSKPEYQRKFSANP
jgi:hypothetical protein